MLSLFTPKTRLADVMNSPIDFHNHVLFGLDDGAQTPEDTLHLIKGLQKLGYKKAIATPHILGEVYENSAATILPRLEEVRTLIAEHQIDFKLNAAAEYMLDSYFLDRMKEGPLLCLKDNYVLVEFSYLSAPLHYQDLFFKMQIAGYQPVLAHPERYPYFHNQFEHYRQIKNAGCKLQLNALSTVGYYGPAEAEIAERLLLEGLIDFVGTDTHHSRHLKAYERKIKNKIKAPLKEALANNQLFDF